MDVANDQDADTCTMSVDGQSDDDGNHMSERGASDRRQECDRSNLSNANEHEHDDDEDIEDTRTRDASIAMDMRDESDDGERTMERGDPNGEQPTSDEDDDGDDADDDDDDDEADAVPVCSSCNGFASWGVIWGQEAEEKYPNFLKVSGVTYYPLLHGDAKGPLQSYIRDVDYHYDGLQLPVR